MCTLIESTHHQQPQQQQQQQQRKRFLPTMPYKDELPISQSAASNLVGIRKRIFSFSVSNIIQHPLPNTASASWAFRKSRSMPSLGGAGGLAGGPLRRWWESSWGWLLSKKPPPFAKDVEMNEEQEGVVFLGCGGSRGRLSDVFYKVRSEILKLVRTQTLPTTHKFRYDSSSYAQNFDDGNNNNNSGRVAD